MDSIPFTYVQTTLEELTAWRQAAAELAQLKTDLTTSRRAVESVQEAWRLDREERRRDLAAACADLVEANRKLADQQQAARNACGGLVEALRVLRTLRDAANTVDCCSACVGDAAAFAIAMGAADELLGRLDIPF